MIRKNILRVLSFVMLICMLVPFGAFAEEAVPYYAQNGGDGDCFELTLLHEGGFPTEKFISDTLYQKGEIISNALFSKDESIEIEKAWDIQEVANLYELVVNSEPELYYVQGMVKIDDKGSKYIIYPQYEIKVSLFAFDDGDEFQAEVNKILSYVSDDMTTLEKVLAVHDYFARFYEYDYSYTRSDIDQLFTDKRGVCQAYADGITYIMQKKLNIDCYTLASSDLNHAWNVVRIDGEWYHLDATWDDPRFNGRDHFGGALHNYFLISSETIRDNDHNHNSYDWTVSAYTKWKYGLDGYGDIVEPTSKRFESYAWASVGLLPFIYYQGEWYYMNFGYLYKYDVNNNVSTEVKQIADYDYSNYDSYEIYEDTVFFKYYWETGVKMIPLKGGGSRILSTLDNAYSFRRNNDVLEYVLQNNYDGITIYGIDLTRLVYKVETPTATINNTDNINVSFTSDTEGAKFYYTTDGTMPTRSSESGSSVKLLAGKDYQVKVMATKDGYNDSDVAVIDVGDIKPNIKELTTWESDGKTYFSLDVENTNDDARAYVAAYDENEVMIGICKLPITNGVASGSFGEISIPLFKAFVWLGDSMVPVLESKEY